MLRLRIYIAIFTILPFCAAQGKAGIQCDPVDLENQHCSTNELCDISTKSCQCLSGFKRVNSTFCEKAADPTSQSTPNYSSLVHNQGNGSIVAGILIPLFLIMFVICGVYANRRYQLLAWLRNKVNRRNENYDEFMIGQDLDDDDPPLRC